MKAGEQDRRLLDLVAQMQKWSRQDWDIQNLDPVIKLMLAAVYAETEDIRDSIDRMGERVADRYYEDFIPRSMTGAMPAITIVEPQLKAINAGEEVYIDENCSFVYKNDAGKLSLTYIPVFRSRMVNFKVTCCLTSRYFSSPRGVTKLDMQTEKPNVLWLGLQVPPDLDSVFGITMLLRKTGGIMPERIYVGDSRKELSFANMDRIEDIELLEPFDSQQISGTYFSFFQKWKESLLNLPDASLLYFTDTIKDRDLFKTKAYPHVFQYCLTSDDMDAIPEKTLWLRLVFSPDYTVPDGIETRFNCIPVANVEVNQVMLTSASPMAKLQKTPDTFFLGTLNTSNKDRDQGFATEGKEYLIRDFDTACYHDGDLYRDVRNLYHHFVQDYYAFLDYNRVKDGELIRKLREIINKIGKSVGSQNARYQFDSGTYAMKNLEYSEKNTTTKVLYLTTKGGVGNLPQEGELLEVKRCPAMDKTVSVIVSATCGRDKATVDERYELLRYYTMTGDRLYTKMDIDAYLRKEILAVFGNEESKRINTRITVEGTGGTKGLQRGLYIDVLFKDKQNYDKAVSAYFASKMQQGIVSRSCLSMPVVVSLVNLDQ